MLVTLIRHIRLEMSWSFENASQHPPARKHAGVYFNGGSCSERTKAFHVFLYELALPSYREQSSRRDAYLSSNIAMNGESLQEACCVRAPRHRDLASGMRRYATDPLDNVSDGKTSQFLTARIASQGLRMK